MKVEATPEFEDENLFKDLIEEYIARENIEDDQDWEETNRNIPEEAKDLQIPVFNQDWEIQLRYNQHC